MFESPMFLAGSGRSLMVKHWASIPDIAGYSPLFPLYGTAKLFTTL